MNTTLLRPLALFLALATLAFALPPQVIGYVEAFALAEDREQALAQLIPGTEEYYFYNALHYQNTGQSERFAETIAQWEKRFKSSSSRPQITRRQILIDYATNPRKSLDQLARELNLTFTHQQEGKARAKQYPTKLDPAQISWQRFLDQALQNSSLNQLHEDAFFPLLKSDRKLTDVQRRTLLARATLPDLPGLVALVATDLQSKESKGFGELFIHRALTTAQLDELLKSVPKLIDNEAYVLTRLSHLHPGTETMRVDPAAREAYLTRAWNFVKKLSPSFNSLKAHILYQRLVLDSSQGKPDPDRFLTYVKLPRHADYISPTWRKEQMADWENPADCTKNFQPWTSLPTIGSDEALVRRYLLHFLKDAENTDSYAPYIAESWLQTVFAETKITHGIGDPERWASLLSPAAFQVLKDRVDLDFDSVNGPANALEFGVDDPVKLRLQVKNVDKLIIKIFEINTLNYYQKYGNELSTDLSLDGLVANHEKTFVYDDAPFRRITRNFDFPEIDKRRGVWVVEFIGGSRSSRAVIRKGKLEAFASTHPSGTLVRVLDESHQPAAKASVWLADRRFACDEKGLALIPFTNEPGQRRLVIEDASGFASLATIQCPSELYKLHAGVHVPREALRPGALATLAIRPTLTVAGTPITLSRLSDIRLILTSTDLDGTATTTTIPDFKLYSDREATHEFRVPDRLASLEIKLLARIVIASHSNQEIEISDTESLNINGELRSDRVDDLYLSLIDGHYRLEFFGRTGEAKPGRNLTVAFHRAGFRNTENITLKTNPAGSVDLGPLDGIVRITATAPGGHQRSWQMADARRSQPAVINAAAGKPLRIPYFGNLDPSELALFAISNGGITDDLFRRLKFNDGFLTLSKLPPGDYRLHFKRSHQTLAIRIAKGVESGNFIFNATRTLETNPNPPAHLTEFETRDEALEIQIANVNKLTRVHLIATRFLPDYDLFGNLGIAPVPGLYQGRPAQLPSLYLSGRRIGDEFRYILERRYGTKFPGNMLERPELLLNPWAIRETESSTEQLAENEDYARKKTGTAAAGGIAPAASPVPPVPVPEPGSPRSIDFLATAPTEMLNLRPDKDGRISIDLKAFGDRQHLHVLVVDPQGASYQQLSLPDRDTLIRDLRLLNALDPAKHFTEQDSVTLLKKGDKLVIPDLLTARLETFDHLGAAYRYLLALREDPTLREFAFIADWEKLKPAEKKQKYSQYACHELSFFLSIKDPGFFKSTVLPYLSNKKDPAFLDDYLLERDLERYFSPYEYARLNVPERILLARQIPKRLDAIRLDLRNRLSLRPSALQHDHFLFEGALSISGLTPGKKGGFSDLSLSETENFEAKLPDLRQSGPPGLSSNRVSKLAELKRNASVSEEVRYKIDASDENVDPFASGKDYQPGEIANLYRAIEVTKEWAENNYYHLPIESHNYDLITENKFWLDFANHRSHTGFGSRHLGEASRSFHESLLALALLDLPFTAPKHETEIDGTTLTFSAAGRAIAFHREIKQAEIADNPPPLLVSQSYFRNDDRFHTVDGEKVDKFVTDEFLAGIVYGGQVVVTNPTSSRQKLDVLIQIPKGSLPVLGHRATATRRIIMEPYTTQRFELMFYFPDTGSFPGYPAHVSKAGKVVAFAEPFTFKVVDRLSKVDETSWAFISQWGTPEQVLDYLAAENLHAIDLTLIAWRFREDAGFMKKALTALDLRGLYDATLFSYGIKHDFAPAVRQFLLMQRNFLNSCGLYLDSELITIDPVERRAYQHLEYKPLLNSRAHQVGENRAILNTRILAHYRQFMRILTEKVRLDDEDKLTLCYYLFLQDRAEEALARLDSVDPAKLPTRLQFDYFNAYAAFYRSDPATARRIADRYNAYPVDRWRERFAAVIAQADEIQGNAPAVINDKNREQLQTQQAAKEPALDLKIEGNQVRLAYRNIAKVQVNYYEMDLEFLFSTNPFVASGEGGFSIIRPNKSETLTLPDDQADHRFALPAGYQSKNVLVEAIGGARSAHKRSSPTSSIPPSAKTSVSSASATPGTTAPCPRFTSRSTS